MDNQITILKCTCPGCPMIWDVILPDGSKGYIKYRWSKISLNKVDEYEPIIEQKIGDEDGLDGFLELSEAIGWLKGKGYSVINKVED